MISKEKEDALRKEWEEKCRALKCENLSSWVREWWLSKISSALEEERMKYLIAFGSYVPLGGDEIEPEVMAKKVTDMWKEIWVEETKKTERERVMKRVEGIKAIPIIGYMGDSSTASYQKEAYNKALSDVTNLINEGK